MHPFERLHRWGRAVQAFLLSSLVIVPAGFAVIGGALLFAWAWSRGLHGPPLLGAAALLLADWVYCAYRVLEALPGWTPEDRPRAPGTSRFATAKEIRCLHTDWDDSIYLGEVDGRPIYYFGDQNVFIWGAIGSGKDTGILVPIAKTYRGPAVFFDPKAEAACITARMSSIRCSSGGTSGTGSERPVPRLSKITTRAYEAARSRTRRSGGTCQ